MRDLSLVRMNTKDVSVIHFFAERVGHKWSGKNDKL